MFEEENSQTVEGRDNPMEAPCFDMTKEVCVMLVDDDKKSVTEMINIDDTVGDNEEQPREKKNLSYIEDKRYNIHDAENNVISDRKYEPKRKRGRKHTKQINEEERQSIAIYKVVRRKACIEWTGDLHAKFIKVVQQLGEGRCFPKDILVEMNVSGLIRMQVASHLQRGEFSSTTTISPTTSSSTPHLNIDNPFNNPFMLALNDVGGGIQEQHGTFFEMLGSQGLQGPIIENTNYRSGLAFDSEDHHTQSDYNMDLNAALETTYSGSGTMFGADVENAIVNDYNLNVNVENVTTYLGSKMMSDTFVENMTINGLGATNTNFQQYIGEPNMSDLSHFLVASYESDFVGNDSNEKENCDAYFYFNNMNNLFQNLGPPSANLHRTRQ
ncbi:hypothetical protein HAX54_044922 [Datura stramonium]|uniref:Uncharacterized protein n=1 Tax=Datura stramonium TaxID=4076 RepID=A0ABS8SR79_DATST|nr:hypothetical protein [Datura stramonium]